MDGGAVPRGHCAAGRRVPVEGAKELAYLCFALSGGLLLYTLVATLRVPGGFLPKWDAWWSLRLGGSLALHDAARIAYEAARKNDTLWAHAAERLGVDNSPAGILDYVATYFGIHVPIIETYVAISGGVRVTAGGSLMSTSAVYAYIRSAQVE